MYSVWGRVSWQQYKYKYEIDYSTALFVLRTFMTVATGENLAKSGIIVFEKKDMELDKKS